MDPHELVSADAAHESFSQDVNPCEENPGLTEEPIYSDEI